MEIPTSAESTKLEKPTVQGYNKCFHTYSGTVTRWILQTFLVHSRPTISKPNKKTKEHSTVDTVLYLFNCGWFKFNPGRHNGQGKFSTS